MNKVVLIGRATADIDLRTTQSGKSVCTFTLAVPREFNRDETDFIRVSAWGKTADILSRYVRKGDRVGLAGHVQVRQYEKDGKPMWTTEIIAESIELLVSKYDSGHAPQKRELEFTDVDDDDESDLPF